MVALNDTTFREALSLWFSTQGEAERTYGQISNWDTSAVTDMSYAFHNKTNFNEDISQWNTSGVTTMEIMFSLASNFNNGGSPLATDGEKWNTCNVKNMGFMFYNAFHFNQDISSWDTSGVLRMEGMFSGNEIFNNGGAPLATALNKWNTSKVNDMSLMFSGAFNFNQDISSWNTSGVTMMDRMFIRARLFNNGGAPLATNGDKWNTSKVKNMYAMFGGATEFKGAGLDTWTFATPKPTIQTMFGGSGVPSSVNNNNIWYQWLNTYDETELTDANLNLPPNKIDSNLQLKNAIIDWFTVNEDQTKEILTPTAYTIYYGPISNWRITSYVTNMEELFRADNPDYIEIVHTRIKLFNKNISKWNTSGVLRMNYMFYGASAFNNGQTVAGAGTNPLNWNTSNVGYMFGMFCNATNFNQNLSYWNTSRVENMENMFNGASAFNNGQTVAGAGINPLNWNTSNVGYMFGMFCNAMNFNQNISYWNTSKVEKMENMFNGAASFNNGGAALATDVDKWNTSRVLTMQYMFNGATAFKGAGLDTWTFAAARPSIVYMFNGSGVPNSVNNRIIWDAWYYKGYSLTDLTEAKLTPLTIKIISNQMLRNAIINWFNVNENPSVESTNTSAYTPYYGPISEWRISADVTNMDSLFRADYSDYPKKVTDGIKLFNKNISQWNTSGVTTMGRMFYGATFFNNGGAPLATDGEKWNTSNVTTMYAMFSGATNFNQDISSWNTSKVLTMNRIFNQAINFNNSGAALVTAVNKWNTSNITDMVFMFSQATEFKGEGLETWTFAATKPTISFMFVQSGVPSSVNNKKIWNAWKLKGYDNNELTEANLTQPMATTTISVVSGWNLIGTTQYLFLNNRTNIQYIYGLSGGSFKLITDNELVPGGYWLYWNAPNGTISTEEFQTESRAIGVVSGWNLIGSTVDMQITSDLRNIQYIYGLEGGSFKLMTSSSVLSAGGYWLYWNDEALGAIEIGLVV